MTAFIEKVQRVSNQYWQLCKEKPLGAFGAFVFLTMTAFAVGSEIFTSMSPLVTRINLAFVPPSASHWFGTDYLGRDVWSRFIFGARNSVLVVISGVALATTAGGLLGIFSGYMGGKIDQVIQMIVDFLLSIPILLMGLILLVALGPGLVNVVITIGIIYAPRINRISRSSALSIKTLPYIEASKAMGHSHWFIIWKHLLPNSFPHWLVYSTALLGAGFLVESGLSFLGVGIPPPYPSWGRDLSTSMPYFEKAPWLAIFPGMGISAVVFGANLLGDAIRDISDPLLKRI